MGFGSPIFGVLNKVTQGWGIPRPHRDGVHEGFDFPVPIGTPVHAIADGVVVTSTDSDDPGGAGRFISIQHANGMVSRYMHLDVRGVAKGARVSKGETIGRSGASGIKNSAAHLHFDLKAPAAKLREIYPFGAPVGGFPDERYGLIGIPAEPFIPTKHSPLVLANAAKFGLPLASSTSESIMGVIGMLGIGVGGYYLWKKYA
jgi:murein DD-endopeptidase MepM/ murein hydrolase activator NlpD